MLGQVEWIPFSSGSRTFDSGSFPFRVEFPEQQVPDRHEADLGVPQTHCVPQASVDDQAAGGTIFFNKAVQRARRRRFGQLLVFHLDRNDAAAGIDNEIDFGLRLRPPEMNLCHAPAQLLSQYQVHQVPEREARVFGPLQMAQDPQGIIPEVKFIIVTRARIRISSRSRSPRMKVSGAVLSDQMNSVDWRALDILQVFGKPPLSKGSQAWDGHYGQKQERFTK